MDPLSSEKDLFSREAYQYVLPDELIAQTPMVPRDHARLLIVERATGVLSERRFYEIESLLETGDRLIVNNTRVIPARLPCHLPGGGAAELFLVSDQGQGCWEVLARPGRKMRPGTEIHWDDFYFCRILSDTEAGTKIVQFIGEGDWSAFLQRQGVIPLPHYIRPQDVTSPAEWERYQTVYGRVEGAVAAPTAGLHFTDALLQRLQTKGVLKEEITLHVGLGTFRPVQADDIRLHKMHLERLMIDPETAARLSEPHQGREICIGTTTCRALETAADEFGRLVPGVYESNLFIYPGYQFKRARALLTNFHLPCSTLLMLVCAFGGYELIMEAYRKAVKDRFRFYSYGDAMLII